MTIEATLAKLSYILSQDISYKEKLAYFRKNIVGEISTTE